MAFKFQGPGDGQNGTMYQPKCFPGYSGPFCQPCPVGWYKSDYSRGDCQKCENKPGNSFYLQKAEISPLCQYQCNPFIEDVSTNMDCLNPIELDIQRIGGQNNFFIVLGLFLLVSLIVFTMLTHNHSARLEGMASLDQSVFSEEWTNQSNANSTSTSPEEKDFELKDNEIWSHSERMYLIGNNTIRNPWIVPKDFSHSALDDPNKATFLKLVDQINRDLQWRWYEKLVYFVYKILFAPLGNQWHIAIR